MRLVFSSWGGLSVFELIALLATLAVALSRRRAFARFARHRALAVVVVGLLASTGSAALSLWMFKPVPRVHDEFSYLLAADTFAHGRLANPTHPLWEHFESLQILQQPTYASKYAPAQGLLLALGQVVGGRPLVGVWIGMGLACGGICWMLQAWMPARWALLGALLATLRLGLTGEYHGWGYWGQSFWGGAAAAFGGSLVFGALLRLRRRPRVWVAVVFGTGLAILANSRPFEGFVVALPAIAGLIVWLVGDARPRARVALGRVVAPVGLVLMFTVAWMGYYNYRVTGHPLQLPYVLHEASYGYAPPLIWQAPYPEPSRGRGSVRAFHKDTETDAYRRQQTLRGFLTLLPSKLTSLFGFYLGVALGVPLLMLPWALRRSWNRFACGTCALLLAALVLETWVQPHYAAPGTALFYGLSIEGLRRMGAAHSRLLRSLTVAIPVVCLASGGLLLAQLLKKPPSEQAGWERRRARIEERLVESGEKHLIIVRYGPQHNKFMEWVYNAADIDSAPVVWAREVDRRHDRRLLEYFKNRHAWLLRADEDPPQLAPFADDRAPDEGGSLPLSAPSN